MYFREQNGAYDKFCLESIVIKGIITKMSRSDFVWDDPVRPFVEGNGLPLSPPYAMDHRDNTEIT